MVLDPATAADAQAALADIATAAKAAQAVIERVQIPADAYDEFNTALGAMSDAQTRLAAIIARESGTSTEGAKP